MAANTELERYLSPADSKRSLVNGQEEQPDTVVPFSAESDGSMAIGGRDELNTPVKGGSSSQEADSHAVTEESVRQQIAEAVR